MTKSWKNTLLCFALIGIFLAPVIQTTTFADAAMTFGREKLKGTSQTAGDYNLDQRGRPNIVEAQDLTAQAYDKVMIAQKAGEWDKTKHAEKAKALLLQAQNELKLAAQPSTK